MNDSYKIEQLEKRVKKMEKEIAELKNPHKKMDTAHPPRKTPIYESVQKTEEAHPIPTNPIDWEHTIGRVWLPRVFILVLVLGVLWGFKAAVDYGFITESILLTLGFVVGAGMVWVGLKQLRQNRTVLGQTILGGSIAVLLLCTFAGHIVYELIPTLAAFLLNVGWTALGIYFAHKAHSETIAILTAIGGFLVPYLIETNSINAWYFVTYMAILYTSLIILAWKMEFHRLLKVSFFVFAFTLAVQTFLGTSSDFPYLIGYVLQHLILLCLFLQKETRLQGLFLTLYTSFIITIGYISIFQADSFIKWSFGLTVLYIAVSLYTKKINPEKTEVSLTIASYALMFSLVKVFHAETEYILLTIEGIVTIYLAYRLKHKTTLVSGIMIYVIGIILILNHPALKVISFSSFAWLVGLASFVALYQIVRKHSHWQLKGVPEIIIGITTMIGLMFLTMETNLLTTHYSSDTQHLFVSAVWVLYALIGIGYGILKQVKGARLIGVVLLFVTLLKIIFIDLPTVSIFIRAVLFMGLGGIGILVSRMFYSGKE